LSTKKLKVVAFCGYARSGKDTIADAIALQSDKHQTVCNKYKFATSLRHAIKASIDYMGLSDKVNVFTENDSEKIMIRNLFIEFGEYCRAKDVDVFANKLASSLKENSDAISVALITDMRYLNEYKIVKEACLNNGWDFHFVYVIRQDTQPASVVEGNSIEELMSYCASHDEPYYVAYAKDGDIQALLTFARKLYNHQLK